MEPGIKLLVITRVYPYPSYGGDLMYNAGLIEGLAAQPGISLDVFCGSEAPRGATVGPAGQVARWHGPQCRVGRMADFRSLISPYPRAAERGLPPKALAELRQLLQSTAYDAALLLETSTAKAIPLLVERDLPCIYVSHNADFDIRPTIAQANVHPVLGPLQRWDAQKYAKTERALIAAADAITAITQDDAMQYQDLRSDLTVRVLTPGYSGRVPERMKDLTQTTRTVCLVGSFEWNAKQANLIDILRAYHTHYRADLASAPKLRIAGRMPNEFHRRLLAEYPAVDFRNGFSDVVDVLKDARLCLSLDALGGGFKLKILDYVMNGVPIVAFEGSVGGSGLEAGSDYIPATSYQDAMQQIDGWLDRPAALQAISESAFARSKTRFAWDIRAEALAEVVRTLLSAKTAGRAINKGSKGVI